jgi:hypothetical protein
VRSGAEISPSESESRRWKEDFREASWEGAREERAPLGVAGGRREGLVARVCIVGADS